MKILILTNLFPPYVLGGYEILCGQVCAEYTKEGHEVVVLTTNHGLGPNDSTMVQPTELSVKKVDRRLELFIPFDRPVTGSNRRLRQQVSRRNQARTEAFLKGWRPDVVHVWSQLRLTLGPAIACHRAGLPMVFSFNDEHITGYRAPRLSGHPRSWVAWFLDRVVYPDITLAALPMSRATAISQVTRTNILKCGVAPRNFSVIYQGIPLEAFPSKQHPGALSSPLRLLYAGQLLKYKGVHTVIEAAHAVARKHPIEVTIAGAGDPGYEKELAELAKSGPAKVQFVGKISRDKISALYQNQDVFVFSSIWQEPFGLTHLEAMASGLPVISTLCGGQGEFLEDDKNCLAFEAEDSSGLAAQVCRLIENPGLSIRIAQTGQQVARDRFSVARYARELLAYLGEAAP